MSLDLDSVLLDRLFQPACDRLAARCTPFDLARVALLLAAGLQFVILAIDLQHDADPVGRVLAGGITVLALAGARQGRHVIARAERQVRPGVLNVRRITMRWQRVAWLVILAWAASVAATQFGPANAAVLAASAAWTACTYFVACSPSTPALRRSRPALAYAR